MTTPADPRQLLAEAPMSWGQYEVVALTGLLSALDGFDVLSITFVAPVVGKAFGVGSGALGLLLSSGLLGMVVGSVALAALADVIGRRPVACISLLIMLAGMLASGFAWSLPQLAALRLVTGVGIGAMVVVINPIAVEFSNLRNRPLALAMMSIGYPLGGSAGGLVSAYLLRHFDWQAVFLAGGLFALVLAPLVILRMPESLSYLLERPEPRALNRVNALLARFGHPTQSVLPVVERAPRAPYREIFHGAQLPVTLRVAAAALLTFFAIYFFLSWHPKLLVDIGYANSAAASISGISSLAGAASCALFGLAARRFGGGRLAVIACAGLGLALIAFGLVPGQSAALIPVTVLCGALVAISTLALYVVAADAFAPRMRATGTGFIIGIGRIGAAISPALAGAMFQEGLGRAVVAGVMGTGALLAAAILQRLRRAAERDPLQRPPAEQFAIPDRRALR